MRVRKAVFLPSVSLHREAALRRDVGELLNLFVFSFFSSARQGAETTHGFVGRQGTKS